MITTESNLLEFMDAHGIAYTRTEHPAVYRSGIAGVETKNLFLCAEVRAGAAWQFYLVMTACEKRLDLKALGQAVGAAKLHFASEEQLLEALGLTPGSVTVLALVNDTEHRVTLLMDTDYWPSKAYLCHPLVNTATLVLEHAQLVRFFGLTGHVPQVVRMPGRG